MLYIYDVYLVCNDGRLKTKKNLNFFTSLPSVMTMTLGKARNLGHSASQLCQVPWARHSAKKIKKNCFAECLPTALGKENPKKRKQALPSARSRHSAKNFFLKIKTTFLCREPTVSLGKGAVTVTWSSRRFFFVQCRCGTREILCRVPDMRHSTKKALP